MEYVEPTSWVPTAGGRIGVWRQGTGEPALLLHGGPGISDYTAPLAAELAAHLDVVRYQQRGVPPTTIEGHCSVESHMADALAVLEVLEVVPEPVWLIGHSWGAQLALHLAVTEPHRWRGVICLETLGVEDDGGEARMVERLFARVPDEVKSELVAIEAALAGETDEVASLRAMNLLQPYYYHDPSQAEPLPAWFRQSATAYSETFDSLRAHRDRGTLRQGLLAMTLPALWIAGGSSPIPTAVQRETAALIPGARFEVIDDAGHEAWVERPGEVGRIVGEFLSAAS